MTDPPNPSSAIDVEECNSGIEFLILTLYLRETGSKATLKQKEQALHEGAIYRRWFAENVLRRSNSLASDAVLIMPLSCYAPDYRDTIHKYVFHRLVSALGLASTKRRTSKGTDVAQGTGITSCP